jgi:hypothetical protein
MKFIKFIIIFYLPLLLWTSCSNDGFYYQDQARARLVGPYIWAVGTDSLSFSFVTSASSVTEKQMNVELWLMGKVTNYDRTANISVVAGKTTATNDMYTVPTTVTLPADSNKVTFPVILKRTSVLQSETVRLYIEVAESKDFGVGVDEQNHLLLKWNDILSKPSNWDDIDDFFGTYSDVKYRFMLANAGVTEFSSSMTWAELQNYKIKLTNALNDYNAAHPSAPLTDENGKLVSFDN